jgi:hypothetical protein
MDRSEYDPGVLYTADKVIAEMDVSEVGFFMGIDCECFTKKQLIKILNYNQRRLTDQWRKP